MVGALVKAREVIDRLAGAVGVQRLDRRVKRLSVGELDGWVESAIVGIGKAYGDWQREGAPDSLNEARMGAASLVVVLEELEERRQAGRI